jgi:hypothetical protein
MYPCDYRQCQLQADCVENGWQLRLLVFAESVACAAVVCRGRLRRLHAHRIAGTVQVGGAEGSHHMYPLCDIGDLRYFRRHRRCAAGRRGNRLIRNSFRLRFRDIRLRGGDRRACLFGLRPDDSRSSVALIGDMDRMLLLCRRMIVCGTSHHSGQCENSVMTRVQQRRNKRFVLNQQDPGSPD